MAKNVQLRILKLWLRAGGALLFVALILYFWGSGAEPITQQRAWSYIQDKASNASLNPHFVYAIVWAESSLNPKANSGYARGLMQISKPAWQMVSRKPYSRAWNWKDNIDVGVDYLAYLKECLVTSGRFSYPMLAASYHYGLGRVKASGFDLSRLPPTKNKIYRALFSGEISPVPAPNKST